MIRAIDRGHDGYRRIFAPKRDKTLTHATGCAHYGNRSLRWHRPQKIPRARLGSKTRDTVAVCRLTPRAKALEFTNNT